VRSWRTLGHRAKGMSRDLSRDLLLFPVAFFVDLRASVHLECTARSVHGQ